MKTPSKVTCNRCGCPQCEYDPEAFSTTCEQCGHEIELPPTQDAVDRRARFEEAVKRVAAQRPLGQRLAISLRGPLCPLPPLLSNLP